MPQSNTQLITFELTEAFPGFFADTEYHHSLYFYTANSYLFFEPELNISNYEQNESRFLG